MQMTKITRIDAEHISIRSAPDSSKQLSLHTYKAGTQQKARQKRAARQIRLMESLLADYDEVEPNKASI